MDVCAAPLRRSSRTACSGCSIPRGERTLFVLGPNTHPTLDDPLPWDDLGDVRRRVLHRRGPAHLDRRATCTRARRDRPAAREPDRERRPGRRPDRVGERSGRAVRRGRPAGEARTRSCCTEGAAGGSYRTEAGAEGRYRPAPLPGPVADTYGAGDVMMAALTLELGAGRALEEALARAATAAAAQLTRRGATPGAA